MSNITTIIVADEITASIQGAGTVLTAVTPQPISTSISAVGASGASSQVHVHTQSSPALTWVINHNLGFKPVISLLTVGGVEMFAEVVHTSINQVTVLFVQPTAGLARCI
jgi:hypothetical protein